MAADRENNLVGHDHDAGSWHAMCDAITDAIALLDSELRVIHVNQSFAGWLGATPESLSGRFFAGLLDGCKAFPHNCAVLRAASSGSRENTIHQISSLCGTYQCLAHPLQDPSGNLRFIVYTLRDVTEQKQREDEQARQNEYLAALHETALSLIARRPLNPILDTILSRAATLVAAPHGFIALLDEQGTEMRIRAARGACAPHVGDRIEPGRDIAGRVWQVGHSLVEDLALRPSESMPVGLAATADGTRTPGYAVGVPLISESHVVGVLLLVAPPQPDRFQFEELALLGQFSELASIAVHNAHLYDQAQAEIAERRMAEAALQRRAAQLEMVNEIGSRLTRVLDLDAILHHAASLIQERFHYHHVAIYTSHPETGSLEMRARAGAFVDLYPPGHCLKVGTGLVGHTALTGETCVANDVSVDPHYVNHDPGRIDTRSELSVPIRLAQNVLGVLDVQSPDRDAFHANDVLLVETLANQVGAALENARLYEAVQHELAERQRVEKSLRESEAALRSIFRAAPIGIGMVTDRVFEWTNDTLQHMVGWSTGQLVGQSARVLYPDDAEYERVGREKYAQIDTQGVGSVETQFVHADGRHVHVLLSSAPLDPEAYASGGRSPVVFTALDITERKRAEEAMRRSETRYRRFVEQSHAGVWEIDREGVTVFANARLADILGYESVHQLVGRRLYDFFSRSYASGVPPFAERVGMNGRQAVVQDCILKDANGADVYAILSTLPHPAEDGTFDGATLFVTDITTRRQMEEALRQSEARYRALFENAGDAIFIHPLSAYAEPNSGRFLAANRVACQRLGYSLQELLSKTPADVEAPEYAVQIPTRIDELQRYGHHFYETVHIRSDGTTIPTELSSRVIEYEGQPAVLVIAREITERKQVEQVLLRTERLAAMGHLAAALAHEINNPLQSMGSSLELALDFPLEEEERLEYLEAVRQEIQRLMTITSRVLDFARPMRTERQPVSTSDVVHYAFTLAEKQLQHNRITFRTDIPEDLPLVRASRDQLAQVFLNLLLNSVEAMLGGGSVHVSARAADDKVIIQFADSGPGIPDNVLRRLFEPFQTTKESGTGLGLAISYSIIQQHGGTITAANGAQGGATFVITLPAWTEGGTCV